uniref:Uncharacterized protein n=1 Tax=Lotharella globosa TaxID=91324 RepID=A0A6U3BR96_9EUKA|mmetsp:Transcript_30843/g.60365  ORF Transcript_30843/g.60365 Transcript_30843/m.60365 type:complete len:375 (+) Transcript_30843:200-1324(+)
MSRILITRTLGNNTIILYGPVEERYSKLHVCDRLYPKSSSSPVRWLNSGSWIGFADTALEAYESVREVPRWFMDRWPGSDQGFFNTLYLSGRYGIKIDMCSEIFATFKTVEFNPEDEREYHSLWQLYGHGPFRHQFNLVYAEKANDTSPFKYLWKYKKTERIPAAMHFNGGSFNKMHDHVRFSDNGFVSAEENQFLHDCSPMRRIEVSMQMTNLPNDATCLAVEHKCMTKLAVLRDERKCGFDDATMEKMASKNLSGLAFFTEMSPVRYFTPLSFEEHKTFAAASHAAVSRVGIDAWLALVDGAHYIPGNHQTYMAHAFLEARRMYREGFRELISIAVIMLVLTLSLKCLRKAWSSKGGSLKMQLRVENEKLKV